MADQRIGDNGQKPSGDKYPELLSGLRNRLLDLLVECGIEPATAQDAAWTATEGVRTDWGGTLVYVPQGAAWEHDKRNKEIYREYNGRNKSEVMTKYGIKTEQRLYQILAKMRSEMIAQRQRGLF